MKSDDPTTDDAPFAHFLNEGATLVIDGCGTRIGIETTEENTKLCDAIHQALNAHRRSSLSLQWGEDGTRTAGLVRVVGPWRRPDDDETK